MTAEVAILNRHAVAMAADSAVTVRGRSEKIYNTVNKLFMLSKHEPVGIMVYSSAELLGVPVETVIKFFRSRILGETKYDDLLDYAEGFFRFLSSDDTLLTAENRLNDLSGVVYRTLATIAIQSEGYPSRTRAKETLAMVRRDLAEAKENAKIVARNPGRADLKKHLQSSVDGWKQHVGRKGFRVSEALQSGLVQFLYESLTREGPIRVNGRDVTGVETGVVVAGFGERNAFPQLVSFEFTYSAFGFTKYEFKKHCEIDHARRAEVVPFAQTDQMESFIYGRSVESDEQLGEILDGCFNKKIKEMIQASGIDATVASKTKAAMELIRDQVKEEFAKVLGVWSSHEEEALLDAIDNLPKEDLAMIAESLIGLTIAKRRASSDSESVGPPVDVAVISKGDGFIWMKRKHYFDLDYNLHFQQSYLGGKTK